MEESSKSFNYFLKKTGGIDAANFWSVCLEDIASVEVNGQPDILVYDLDNVDGYMVQELARSAVGK